MTVPDSSSGEAVRFEGVCKSYGDVDALSDFDLTVHPGELVTLLGPSGSGKTTALNVLAGFTKASAGRVFVGDREVQALPPEKRGVGMVFQSYSLFPHLNVFDNIAFPLKLRGVSRKETEQRVEEGLEMIQMLDLARRMPAELSGGQKQRVAFARAVIFRPPVLLMDEPLAALDQKLREIMQAEIRAFHQRLGCTIVFVTHDQNEALALSDRIAVMGDGKLAQIDTPTRIYDAPKSRYVAEFIGKTNLLNAQPSGSDLGIPALGIALAQGELTQSLRGAAGQTLSLRPERIFRTQGRETAAHPTFTATVKEALFLGDTVQYSLSLSNGDILMASERRESDAALVARETELQFGFYPVDLIPIPDTP